MTVEALESEASNPLDSCRLASSMSRSLDATAVSRGKKHLPIGLIVFLVLVLNTMQPFPI